MIALDITISIAIPSMIHPFGASAKEGGYQNVSIASA